MKELESKGIIQNIPLADLDMDTYRFNDVPFDKIALLACTRLWDREGISAIPIPSSSELYAPFQHSGRKSHPAIFAHFTKRTSLPRMG